MNQIYELAIRVVNAFNKTEKELVKVEEVQLVEHKGYTYLTVGPSKRLKAAYRFISQRNILKRLIRLPKGFPGSLIMVLLMFLVGACQHKYLITKPDETNFDRYNHKQVMGLGLSQKEVMKMFGSPHTVNRIFIKGEYAVQFVYYRSVFCDNIYCFVEFSESENEVIDYGNFRQEYSGLVKVD